MKPLPLCIIAWSLLAICTSRADDQAKRFLEFPDESATTTFDLATVQMVAPGRFTVVQTVIDNPDVMRFELKALDVARSYCARDVGKYPIPPELLTLGSPDESSAQIEVIHDQTNSKSVMMLYPYKMLGGHVLHCDKYLASSFAESRQTILNGVRSKMLFDCKRGLWGAFLRFDDDPTKARTGNVPIMSRMFAYYVSVCKAVTHELPYFPQ